MNSVGKVVFSYIIVNQFNTFNHNILFFQIVMEIKISLMEILGEYRKHLVWIFIVYSFKKTQTKHFQKGHVERARSFHIGLATEMGRFESFDIEWNGVITPANMGLNEVKFTYWGQIHDNRGSSHNWLVQTWDGNPQEHVLCMDKVCYPTFLQDCIRWFEKLFSLALWHENLENFRRENCKDGR